ncbi:opacity protein-like surface antigen [Legionella moravica]|uniref:Opacity protein-like surface antigen n=1 Tax=Legionella moravica TaxID=39962 RepID=A0A378JXN7_9GAMM|nr:MULTISPECIES: outer membrane beta-barrel protein [Legionella]KTD30898.1 opacity protein-like surface antigen [Legionella moravica]RUR20277.1 porin family protein [Legionella sp. km535]STX63475.1 opacity protein-like surface antigen [Legionella moravica]
MRISLLSAALLATGIASAATPVDGWYTSVFGGYTFIPGNIDNYTIDYIHRDRAGYNSGYNAGGRIGFQSNPLRYEAEYTYLRANLKHFDIDHINQRDASGYSSGNFLMANIYYDFPEMLPAISPYLGLGIGYAYLQANLSSSGPIAPSFFSVSDSAFAYQGTAGITYNFAENYAVNLAYRYVATDKPNGFGEIFQAHIASAGAVYRFDQVNYK